MQTANNPGVISSVISGVSLRVPVLDGLDRFYQNILGMQRGQCGDNLLSFAFDQSGCRIVFNQDNVAAYVDRPNGFYWKIGITVKNLGVAVDYLRKHSVEVSSPRQFLDIGYMSHLQDPNGFTIELLQQGFEGREQPVPDWHPIGAQATLAHITLRVTDIQAAQQYLVEQLGMRLMSVQRVDDYNFCLYFYTWSDEALPESNVESVENREWLWARPYTLIELQHLLSPEAVVYHGAPDEAGFAGVHYTPQGISQHASQHASHGRPHEVGEVFLTLAELVGNFGPG